MLLTKEFLSRYKNSEVMAPLGSFVYYRTYSRWLAEKGRRETWLETVQRAVEYNCSLDPNTTISEAEELFDNIYNLRTFLSGRTFWIGGTPAVNDHALANFNCSLVVLDSFDKLKELFYALMVGTGAGFRALEKDVKYLPKIRYVVLTHKAYSAKQKSERLEATALTFTHKNAQAIIHVGDSKEGWTQALKLFFDIITRSEYRHVLEIVIDYDSVRPRGERLARFGGTASGHDSLKNMFLKFDKVLKTRLGREDYGKVRAIDMLDFANIIAENVVVGGVRRSAEIGLIDANDEECIKAKNGLYSQDSMGNWVPNLDIIHRTLSNNTIIHFEKPKRKFWSWQFEQMRFSGEPAFYNGREAERRNPNFKGTNPCGEVLLDDRQTCNLVTLNLMAFVKDGELDRKKLLNAQYLNARASYRMTLVELELPEWDKQLKRDRLLGVSLTGYQDGINALGLSNKEQRALLRELRDVARLSADRIAEELGLNKSLLITTIKPEGTLSLLPTVSSGLHFSHAPYYVRRIRINADDALVKVCKELGYPVHPENGQTIETATTLVIEFPVKAPDGKTKYDVSAIEQLEIYKMFMECYVDHNASITVSVRANEWEDVEAWVYQNWDSVIGITFLSLEDSYYPLLPYETISKEEYKDRINSMVSFNASLLTKYEHGEEHELETSECAGGACPIR
ncbi:MAG: ribonucleoside-triphosphate reductase, adenosylcobalamin-dependent [Clostridia bacterium]|jgi:ribonucleoside-diphosphate reductase alpha chain/ribonucleoside-triphosphate reductase|nr:ribonucleoside-triphosphate reductase, adenosylcobalamin-dependent [Clostridia bacterium]